MKGHENNKKIPIRITDHGEQMVRDSERKNTENACHAW